MTSLKLPSTVDLSTRAKCSCCNSFTTTTTTTILFLSFYVLPKNLFNLACIRDEFSCDRYFSFLQKNFLMSS